MVNRSQGSGIISSGKKQTYLHPGVEETILDPTHVNAKPNIFELCLEIEWDG